ncbi:hypothetical protein [Mycobacterium sp. SMC-4]|uniref:hypothetical protein n=1 Tax=Mycobacterium sp. SMC-4 TaxID=2857059 RepID=UPI0021B2F461|nr:hypothetical protein [Mycobacterium sp. SMC-4]UXA19548.1 hypothetical protein KXD98_08100 [Mycobacterium sp. SMC-4]
MAVTLGQPDANGVRPPTTVQVNVHGCRFRPLRVEETAGAVEIATEVWKCTAPPAPAVLAATSIDELVYDGTKNPQRGADDVNVYRIDGGVKPFNDESEDVYKVTVVAHKHKG